MGLLDWACSMFGIVDHAKVFKGDLPDDASEARKVLADRLAELENTVVELRDIIEHKVEPNLLNRTVLTYLILLLMAFVLFLMIGMVNLYNRLPKSEPQASSSGTKDDSILKEVPNNPIKRETVCLLSFSDTFRPFNQRLFSPVNARMCEYVIRNHADIPFIPPAVVTIMCVEFTERHVIIEEEGIGQGNIRRLTADAINKLGSKLIIVYTHDPGSTHLPSKAMYNNDIYCVSTRSDLRRLAETGRFFSVKDKLSDVQRRNLDHTIMDALSNQ